MKFSEPRPEGEQLSLDLFSSPVAVPQAAETTCIRFFVSREIQDARESAIRRLQEEGVFKVENK